MKQLLRLTLFQLKDKLDFSWIKSKKALIQKIVFGVLRFVIVAALTFAVLFLLSFIEFIKKYQSTLPLFTVFITLVIFLNLCSSTLNLMKSLYSSDDNKVLITLPVTPNQLFFSKIVVYYIFELKKSLDILVPGIVGFLIFGVIQFKGPEVHFITILWMIIPTIFLILSQVLLAALLSIPFLFIYRFFKKFPIMELILVIVLVGAGLFLVIKIISFIPEDIDLNTQWPSFVNGFGDFVSAFHQYAYPVNFYSKIYFGEVSMSSGIHYLINETTFIKIAIAIGAAIALGLIDFLLIKPFYFRMINKNFEFDKMPPLTQKKNVKHKKYVTFANKEFKLSFRDFDISGSYIAVYLIVPILLFFIDRVFAAIDLSEIGYRIAYAFNALLTILPLLASNSTIATLYSKEGRTAYIIKSNPVNPFIPLTSKLLFNLIFSIPSIVGCAIIFANFSSLGFWIAVLFSLSVLLLQYAHIFYSASQDIMNPQNEVYATTGSDFNNPNETKSTIVAFISSFVITGAFYLMLNESYRLYNNYASAFIRLFIASAVLFAGFLYLFIKKIQAFYYEK